MFCRSLLALFLWCGLMAMAAKGELCTPDRWEGFQAIITGFDFDGTPGVQTTSTKFSYDAVRKCQSFLTSWNKRIIRRFDTGHEYTLDLDTNVCTTKKLDTPYEKLCLNASAKHLGDHELGLKGNGLVVSAYSYFNTSNNFTTIVSVSKQDDVTYIPVEFVVYGTELVNMDNEAKTSSALENGFFADISLGIEDPSVFEIPSQCKKVKESSLPTFLLRK